MLRRLLSITAILSISLFFNACTPMSQYDSSGNEIIEITYLHKYGVPMAANEWEMSGRSGQVVSTSKQGVVCTQNYYNGHLEGESIYTFPFSHDVEKVHMYSNNQLQRETIFYRGGTPKREVTFVENGHDVREWFETGSVKSNEWYNGEKLVRGSYYDIRQQHTSSIENGEGVRIVTDPYGQLISTEHYREGDLASRTTYHPNGSPNEIIPFQNGVIEGSLRTFYPGGEPKTIESWKNGVQEGITTTYEDGVMVEEIPYVNGKRHGVSRTYREGIAVSQEVSWKDGQRYGPTHTHLEGKVATDWYLKDSKVSKGYYDAFNFNRPTG